MIKFDDKVPGYKLKLFDLFKFILKNCEELYQNKKIVDKINTLKNLDFNALLKL